MATETSTPRGLADYIIIFLILNTFYMGGFYLLQKIANKITIDDKILTGLYLVIVFFTMKLVNDIEVERNNNKRDALWLTVHPIALVLVPVIGLLNFSRYGNALKRPFAETIAYPILNKFTDLGSDLEDLAAVMAKNGTVKDEKVKEGEGQIVEGEEVEQKFRKKIKNIIKMKMDLELFNELKEVGKGEADASQKMTDFFKNDPLTKKIENLLKWKNRISEFIWLMLAGSIVSNITILSLRQ